VTPHGIQTVRTIRLGHNRKITDVTSNKYDLQGETTLELDSHADTCVLGRDALIIHNYSRLEETRISEKSKEFPRITARARSRRPNLRET
jgi:hypothetical protein